MTSPPSSNVKRPSQQFRSPFSRSKSPVTDGSSVTGICEGYAGRGISGTALFTGVSVRTRLIKGHIDKHFSTRVKTFAKMRVLPLVVL